MQLTQEIVHTCLYTNSYDVALQSVSTACLESVQLNPALCSTWCMEKNTIAEMDTEVSSETGHAVPCKYVE